MQVQASMIAKWSNLIFAAPTNNSSLIIMFSVFKCVLFVCKVDGFYVLPLYISDSWFFLLSRYGNVSAEYAFNIRSPLS